MKRFALAIVTLAAAPALAATNVSPGHKHAWSENTGWLNFRDAGASGARLLSNHLAGSVWSENVGWISLGQSPGPYANTTGADSGVNRNPATGFLSGYAWGENVGWINFRTSDSLGASGARIENNRLRGYAWGENIGWINLEDATAFVAFCPADLDGDGAVGSSDLAALLGSWGSDNPTADLNADSAVNASDLASLLGSWGVCQ